MKGSEKQVKWAEDIKATQMSKLADFRAMMVKMAKDQNVSPENQATVFGQIDRATDAIKQVDSAIWWIDTRSLDAKGLINLATKGSITGDRPLV